MIYGVIVLSSFVVILSKPQLFFEERLSIIFITSASSTGVKFNTSEHGLFIYLYRILHHVVA